MECLWGGARLSLELVSHQLTEARVVGGKPHAPPQKIRCMLPSFLAAEEHSAPLGPYRISRLMTETVGCDKPCQRIYAAVLPLRVEPVYETQLQIQRRTVTPAHYSLPSPLLTRLVVIVGPTNLLLVLHGSDLP